MMEEQMGQKKVAQVVYTKVNFKAIFGLSSLFWGDKHSSIVYKDVEFIKLLNEVRCERSNWCQIT